MKVPNNPSRPWSPASRRGGRSHVGAFVTFEVSVSISGQLLQYVIPLLESHPVTLKGLYRRRSSDAPPPSNPHTAEQCGLKGPLVLESPASGVSFSMPGGSSEMFGNRVRFRLAPFAPRRTAYRCPDDWKEENVPATSFRLQIDYPAHPCNFLADLHVSTSRLYKESPLVDLSGW